MIWAIAWLFLAAILFFGGPLGWMLWWGMFLLWLAYRAIRAAMRSADGKGAAE